jgi:hypothetical protein
VLVLAVVLTAAVKMMREMVGLVVKEEVQTAAQGIVQAALKLGEVIAVMAAVVAIGAPWAVRMWVLMKMRLVMGTVLRLLVGKMFMMSVRVVVGSAICRGNGLDLRGRRTIDSSFATQALLVCITRHLHTCAITLHASFMLHGNLLVAGGSARMVRVLEG